MQEERQLYENFNRQEFVARLQVGDETAYQELDSVFFTKFTAYVESEFGIANEDAKDLVQDVMVIIFQKIELYDPKRGKFLQWAFQILRNRCNDWLRKHKKAPHISLTDDILYSTTWGTTKNKKDNLSPLEKLPTEVREAILRLPGRYQQFLGLKLLGVNESHILEIMNIKTKGAFRSLNSRVLAKLRQEIPNSKQ